VGTVHPDRSVIDQLERAEQHVVRVLRDGISDEWLIIPRLDIAGSTRPHEIDVLLVHPDHGLLAVEVKGGAVRIDHGVWQRRSSRNEPWSAYDTPPPRQSQDAAYALRDRLRTEVPGLSNVDVPHAVVLTDVTDVHGALPVGTEKERVLLSPTRDDIEAAIHACLRTYRHQSSLTPHQIESVVRFVAPNVEFTWDPDARSRFSRESLDRISSEHIRAMGSLDCNRRVLVTGTAGSGKTRLAILWALQALRRGDRTLVICYNDPLADFLGRQIPDSPQVDVGGFLRVARQLPGIPPIEEPANSADRDRFWNRHLIDHLLAHVGNTHAVYDTIIIDERQDFASDWMTIVERLVKPNGRILCVADPRQDLYNRGFVMPTNEDGWMLGNLSMNCRNSRTIARLLRRHGGGPTNPASPEGEPIVHHVAESNDDMLAGIVAAINRERERGTNLRNLAILTRTGTERNLIRTREYDGIRFGSWESRSDTNVACETIMRAKGIESDAVIVVALDPNMPLNEFFVAASRARSTLTFVGHSSLAPLIFE
jgi:hypothetical protein